MVVKLMVVKLVAVAVVVMVMAMETIVICMQPTVVPRRSLPAYRFGAKFRNVTE